MSRFLLQVDDEHGTASVIVDDSGVTKHQRKLLQQALGHVLDDLGDRDRWMVLAILARMTADEAAYERECQRRGLLL